MRFILNSSYIIFNNEVITLKAGTITGIIQNTIKCVIISLEFREFILKKFLTGSD